MGVRAVIVVVPVVVLVSGAALAGCGDGSAVDSDTAADGALEANAVVTAVVDGDTIDVVIGGRDERVRLIGIDTPEIAHDAFGDRPARVGECFGDEATGFTSSVVPVGTPVHLERDVVGRDDYGRLLAYVYRASDGVFVNEELVRSGYAQPLTIPPNVTHAERFVDAARAAEAGDLGLWGACRLP
jgi:micrococcal nuclease